MLTIVSLLCPPCMMFVIILMHTLFPLQWTMYRSHKYYILLEVKGGDIRKNKDYFYMLRTVIRNCESRSIFTSKNFIGF